MTYMVLKPGLLELCKFFFFHPFILLEQLLVFARLALTFLSFLLFHKSLHFRADDPR